MVTTPPSPNSLRTSMTLHISSLPPQVLTSIFWFCGTYDWVSLATTSRAFSPLALRCIWHTIPSFATFIYTLHPDLWTYTEVYRTIHTLPKVRECTPTRELVADDFVRFRLYSPLVRVINEPWTAPGGNLVLSAPLWDAFQKHCLEPLPNLHTVSCPRLATDLGKRFGDHLYTLLGASLWTLELEVQHFGDDHLPRQRAFNDSEWDTTSPKLLTRLGQQCPQLQNFRLDPSLFAANSTNPLADAVSRWDSLQSFQALGTPLQANTVKHLASLPCLYLLKANVIGLPTPAVEDSLIARPGSLTFPALRELVVHSNDLGTCTSFVEAVRSSLLENVVLYATEHTASEGIRSLCTALSRHISLKGLLIGSGVGSCAWRYGEMRPSRHFPLPTSYLSTSNLEPAPLTLSVLAPLLSLRLLEYISLRGTCYASLDDRAIPDLVRAWPNLEHAMLCPNASHPYETHVTLVGLAPLAALHRLYQFKVALSDVGAEDVDAAFKLRPARLTLTMSDRLHDSAPSSSRACPMKLLYVGHARLGKDLAEGVSAALSAWFPRLLSVNGLILPGDCTAEEVARMGFESDEAAELYWRWSEVGRRVYSYAKVRAQEQRWAVQRKTSIEGDE